MKHLNPFEQYLNESDRTPTEGQSKEKLDEAYLLDYKNRFNPAIGQDSRYLQTAKIESIFDEALEAIANLEYAFEQSEFQPGVHDPKRGVEVQRTKEEFIKGIEDIARKLYRLEKEYTGVLPKGLSI
jgi:hypothetical protein